MMGTYLYREWKKDANNDGILSYLDKNIKAEVLTDTNKKCLALSEAFYFKRLFFLKFQKPRSKLIGQV